MIADPRAHSLIQHLQWQSAAIENLIVEVADVESVAQLIFRVLAKLENFQLPKLVG